MKRQEKIITSVTAAVLLVVVLVIFVVAGVYTEWFKHKFAYFYVSVGKTKYMQDADVVLGNARFDIRYVLKKNVGYTVKVLPAGDAVTFELDGNTVEYTSEVKDVTAAFDIEKDEKGFTIQCRQKSLQGVLETMYPGREVSIISENVDNSAHFKLVVTAGDESTSIALTFRCLFGVEDVEFDSPSLVL